MASYVLLAIPALVGAALVYSSVGLGGGTLYLALLALSGIPIEGIPPIVLILNTIVSTVAWWNFRRAGYFSLQLTIPFLLTSIPMAFIAGTWNVGERLLVVLMAALLLLVAAVRVLVSPRERERAVLPRTVWLLGPPLGLLLGVVAGMVGIGGGIFLAPLLLHLGWASQKLVAGTTSAFIALNSSSGLVAHSLRTVVDPGLILLLVGPVIIGGVAGSYLGSAKLPASLLKKVLAGILVVASASLMVRLL